MTHAPPPPCAASASSRTVHMLQSKWGGLRRELEGRALKLRGPAGPSLFENKVVKKYLGIRGEK